jgi:murein DD-endopeptidase MepM/ murein hydrolase activator NlpD
MKTKLLRFMPFCVLAIGLVTGCNKDNLPAELDWSVVNNPSRFPLMNGKVALVYELKVKNSSIDTYTFESVNVKNDAVNLLNLAGSELDTIISIYHSTQKSIRAGETAFLFLWVELSADQLLPESLTQTVQITRITDGKQYSKEMKVTVDKTAPVIISAPLKARRYAAVGAPSNESYHRRTINFLDEKFWTSERYAVDFIGLDDGNRYREGRQNDNIDYYGYNDIIYSTTTGEVVSVIDTLPDNVPPNFPDVVSGALYRAGGNQVVVKVSEGVYVFYGHLVRASIELHLGDRVEVGQPLGRLGNSGNSDAPQLHLQVMDGADPLRSNGIPWVFDRFILHGNITGYDHTDGLIKVTYLPIQQEITTKNLKGDAVVGFE